EDGVAVVAPLVVPGEIPVTSHREDVAVLVRRKASIALPDRRLSSIGRGVEGALLPKRVGVVRHQPAVIRTNVAGRAPREIDRVFGQKERGAGIFAQCVEGHLTVGCTGAGPVDRSFDFDGASKFFGTRGDGESV